MAIICPNPKLDISGDGDHLHHFGIPNEETGFDAFADVKFILCGGSGSRMRRLAEEIHSQLGAGLNTGPPVNLSKSDRFVLYKVGPIICVNSCIALNSTYNPFTFFDPPSPENVHVESSQKKHGMGCPSLSIMLNEILKLLYYSRASNVTLIRCGTSGGIGVEPRTLVVSTQGVNGELQTVHVQYVTGSRVETEAVYDKELSDDLSRVCQKLGLPSVRGKTLSADGFYEEQCRENGLFCVYENEDAPKRFIKQLYEMGVRNIEMESTCMASMCSRAGVKAGAICVALVNRLETDVVNVPEETLHEWESLPGRVVVEYLREKLGL